MSYGHTRRPWTTVPAQKKLPRMSTRWRNSFGKFCVSKNRAGDRALVSCGRGGCGWRGQGNSWSRRFPSPLGWQLHACVPSQEVHGHEHLGSLYFKRKANVSNMSWPMSLVWGTLQNKGLAGPSRRRHWSERWASRRCGRSARGRGRGGTRGGTAGWAPPAVTTTPCGSGLPGPEAAAPGSGALGEEHRPRSLLLVQLLEGRASWLPPHTHTHARIKHTHTTDTHYTQTYSCTHTCTHVQNTHITYGHTHTHTHHTHTHTPLIHTHPIHSHTHIRDTCTHAQIIHITLTRTALTYTHTHRLHTHIHHSQTHTHPAQGSGALPGQTGRRTETRSGWHAGTTGGDRLEPQASRGGGPDRRGRHCGKEPRVRAAL